MSRINTSGNLTLISNKKLINAENAGSWNKNGTQKIYYSNGNQFAMVGIGTEIPNNRLSFGNSSLSNRYVTNVNEANIALNELSDGTDATGIGFYEKYQFSSIQDNNTLYGSRYFTGIKFVVNNSNSNTMETTANNNIKMLLRDDATLILGHNINNIESLESFSTAKLDVSGNIRTSQFLILSEITNITGDKPRGSIRYNGTDLIYVNSKGNDVKLLTELTSGITASWSEYQDSGGNNIGIYKDAQIGISTLTNTVSTNLSEGGNFSTLYNNMFSNIKFSVEGNMAVGNLNYLGDISGVIRDGYDNLSGVSEKLAFNMGVLSVQNAIGINNHKPKAAIDIGHISTPLIIAGNNSDVSNNSVVFGNNSSIKGNNTFGWGNNNNLQSSYSFIFGESNNTFSLNNKYSIVFGKNNDISSNSCYLFGEGNKVNSLNTKQNFIVGENNNIFDASYVFVMGNNNNIGALGGGISNSANNCRIFGNNNILKDGITDTFVIGDFNTISLGENNLVSGKNIIMGDVNYGVGLGYKSQVGIGSGADKVVFAFGTETAANLPGANNGNVFTISENGDLLCNNIKCNSLIAKDADLDLNIFTSHLKEITIGNAAATLTINSKLSDIKCADIIASDNLPDSSRNIFTTTKHIYIGGPNSKVYVQGEFVNVSDRRIKTNIHTLTNSLHKVNQLRGVEYNRVDVPDKNKKYIGLIAQEVKDIIPELVVKDNNDMQAINYTQMIGLLVESIKDLTKQNKILSDKINNIEQKLS